MASSSSTETTPLISSMSNTSRQQMPATPQRTVTFNPTVSSSIPSQPSRSYSQGAQSSGTTQGGQPMLSSLNSKLRRRNSSGAPVKGPPAPKIGPQRTTRTAQKLKLLPD